MQPQLSCKDLFKTFNPGRPTKNQVLNGISLEIEPGKTQFILGGNGAGKTTLLRILSGMFSPDSGEVLFQGESIHGNHFILGKFKKSLGFFSANTGLYERLTVLEFLEYFGFLYEIPQEKFKTTLDKFIQVFDMAPFLETKCMFLSSGQKQKTNIARSLLHDPPIFIMDEPTMGLDIESTAAIRDFLVQAREDKKTLIIVTHNMDLVKDLGGKIAFLAEGKIKINSSLENLYEQSKCQNLTDAYRYFVPPKT